MHGTLLGLLIAGECDNGDFAASDACILGV
jgi:hypothetical protein